MASKSGFEFTRGNLFMAPPEQLVIVGLDTEDGPSHLLYDERVKLPLDEAKVKNIAAYGILQPVAIRKNGDTAEVVDGRQRVRAAREINRVRRERGEIEILVPCVRNNAADLPGVVISANEIRQEDSPMVKARKLQRYLASGRTEAEAEVTFGVSGQSIRNWLALLDLAPEVQAEVDAKRVSASAALVAAETKQAEQGEVLAEAAKVAEERGEKLAARHVKAVQAARKAAKSAKAPKAPEAQPAEAAKAAGSESETSPDDSGEAPPPVVIPPTLREIKGFWERVNLAGWREKADPKVAALLDFLASGKPADLAASGLAEMWAETGPEEKAPKAQKPAKAAKAAKTEPAPAPEPEPMVFAKAPPLPSVGALPL